MPYAVRSGRGLSRLPRTPSIPSMTSTICFLATLLALLTIPLVAIAWFIETPAERARRRHRAGWSQRRIADRQGVTRYRVRCWLAA